MKIYKISQNIQFFHGSFDFLPNGTILIPQIGYENRWGHNSFYQILEKYRPANRLSSKESVFMCNNIDDIDLSGGATNYIYKVLPLGKIEQHDVNWATEIDLALDEKKDDNELRNISLKYWNGIPHYNESVWEFVTPMAKVISLVDGDNL